MENDRSIQTAEVAGLTWFTPDLFAFELRRNEISFTPGDCVSLFAEEGNISRPYSIASGVHDSVLRFLIRKMEGGGVSTYLAARQPGDRVRLSLPFGWFHPGQDCEGDPFVFIATGTGIAPFLSYIQSRSRQMPIRCLYGVRRRQDAIGLAELRACCPIDLAVSRERVANAFHGRVTGLLDRFELTPDCQFYLCGLDAMIQTVAQWLEARGIQPFNIHREVFFHASRKPTRLALHPRR